MEKSKRDNSYSCAGRSIQDMIWEELDGTMDELMRDGAGAEPESKGYAAGLAYALAMMRNPYDVETAMETIREEALDRWEERDTE